MSGIVIAIALAKADATLVNAVPIANMYPGDVPLGKPLPALGFTQVSASERNTLSGNEAKQMCWARIRVRTNAASYTAALDINTLVRKALRNKRGTIAGFEGVSVVPDIDGPDMEVPGPSVHLRTKDFMVWFLE